MKKLLIEGEKSNIRINALGPGGGNPYDRGEMLQED
ncbi:MAG: hypothetical protein CM15mP74_00110 [Halieaceae bacterium]|nr:MAG: hypothetical protein CM15mP74_00110 [Halieaceae bacterium]